MQVDITKENPLKTIVKNGFIPVVRFSSEGFKNYSQAEYKESHKESFKDKEPPIGCFVHVGGVQGRYISGAHIDEPMNIGYVSPEADIFCTYSATKNGIKSFDYNKAKDKFKDVIEGYKLYKQVDGLFTTGEMEDFDLLAEAIVKEEDVTPVISIDPKDYYLLAPFTSDDALRLMCMDIIFEELSHAKTLPEEFISQMGEEDYYEQAEAFDKDSDNFGFHGIHRFQYFRDFFDLDSLFQEITLKNLHDCLSGKSFPFSTDEVLTLKQKILEFNEFKKNFKPEHDNSIYSTSVYNNNGYLSVEFYTSKIRFRDFDKPKMERINFVATEDDFTVTIIRENPAYQDAVLYKKQLPHKNTYEKYSFKAQKNISKKSKKKKQGEVSVLYEDDLLSNELRYLFYDFLTIYDKYVSVFKGIYKPVLNLAFLSSLRTYKAVKELLFESAYDYEVDDATKVVTVRSRSFTVEYNVILRDAIVTIPDSEKVYYNPDTVPKEFDSTILNRILEVLLLAEPLFC